MSEVEAQVARDVEPGAFTASTDVVPPAAESVAQHSDAGVSDAGAGGGTTTAYDATAQGGASPTAGDTLHGGDSASVALDGTGEPGSAAASAAAASRRRRKKRRAKARAGARDPLTPRTLRGRPEWNGDIELPNERYETSLSQRVSRQRNLRRQRLMRRRMQQRAKDVRGAPNAAPSGGSSVGAATEDSMSTHESAADMRRESRGSWGTISLTSEADEPGRISDLQSPGPPCTAVASGIEVSAQTEGGSQVPPLQMSASNGATAASSRRGKRSPARRRSSGRLRVGRPATADATSMSFSTAAATMYQPYAASLHSMRSTKSGSRSMPSTPMRRSRSTPAHLMYSPHHHYDGALRRKRPGLASSSVLSKSMNSRRPRDFYSKQPAIFSCYSMSKFKAPPAYSMGTRLKSARQIRIDIGYPEPPGPDVYDSAKSFAAASRTPPRVTFGHRTPLPDPDKSPRPGPGGTYSIPSFAQESIKAQKGATFGQRLKSQREIAIACGFPTTPAPGGTYKVPSFVKDNAHYRRGVQFGHRLKSDLDRKLATGDLGPAPGGTGEVPSFAEENRRAVRGSQFGHRLPDKREILRAIGFPEPPAPGGNCKVPSFVEENQRLNKGVVFGNKWPDINELRDKRGYLQGPGPNQYDIIPPPLQVLSNVDLPHGRSLNRSRKRGLNASRSRATSSSSARVEHSHAEANAGGRSDATLAPSPAPAAST